MGIQLFNAGGAAMEEAEMVPPKRLRRLPHVFSRVLELPLPAHTDVTVHNFSDAYRFIAPANGLTNDLLHPNLIRIHPGVIKLLVGQAGILKDRMEPNKWRFRLPESVRLDLASVFRENDQLIVIVPKGVDREIGGFWNKGMDFRMVAVQ